MITHQKKDKSELIRIVKYNETIQLDKEQNLPGRGVYIDKNPETIEKIKAKKVLHKAFRTNVAPTIYDEIIKKIKGE